MIGHTCFLNPPELSIRGEESTEIERGDIYEDDCVLFQISCEFSCRAARERTEPLRNVHSSADSTDDACSLTELFFFFSPGIALITNLRARARACSARRIISGAKKPRERNSAAGPKREAEDSDGRHPLRQRSKGITSIYTWDDYPSDDDDDGDGDGDDDVANTRLQHAR